MTLAIEKVEFVLFFLSQIRLVYGFVYIQTKPISVSCKTYMLAKRETAFFFSPVVLDSKLWISLHLTAFVIHLITVFIQYGLFLST